LIEAALATWLQTGSSRAAAKKHGVDDSTIRTWRERRPEVWDAVRHAHADAIRESRLATAAAFADVARLVAFKLREGIGNGAYSEPKDLVQAGRLATDYGDRIGAMAAGAELGGIDGGLRVRFEIVGQGVALAAAQDGEEDGEP
jgi:hypothetical protein